MKCKVRLLVQDLASVLMQAFSVINFPPSAAFTAPHKFWYVVFKVVFNFPSDFFFDSWIA